MDKQKKLNKLKNEKERLSTILLSKKKLAKENSKFMFWTLIFPLLFTSSSFIMNCIFSSTYTYVLLISSLAIFIPSALIDLTIAIDGGYKKILQNRIKNIQSKIKKIESFELSKNKSINESERIFLGIEQPKKEKTWDDVLYTEEEIHQYMQMPEAPATFNPETIFGTTEEEHIDNLQNKQSGPVLTKKLTPPRNTGNK